MKVCLINPPTTEPTQRDLYFPMALLTLGGVLKECGVQAELWDFELYFKKVRNSKLSDFRKLLAAGVSGSRSKVFGISSICSNLPMSLWIAKTIKETDPGALVILGGPQPSSIPLQILENFPWIDVVVVGEGEVTLEEMAKAGFEWDRMASIEGLFLSRNGKVLETGKRALAANMDVLPLPDYSLIDLEEYRRYQGKDFLPHVEVGRGCPYNCTFCSTALMWEKDFRVKSPKRILEEMEIFHRHYGFTSFSFIHDNFTTSKKFVNDFCGFMEEHNTKGFTWYASSRTDCIDSERLRRMHRCGLRGLFFGIETGSERMQKIIKKSLRFEHFEPLLETMVSLDMDFTTAFILGFPEETAEDVDATIRRALHYRNLGTPRIFFSKIAALTGTSLYRDFVGRLEDLNTVSNTNPHHYAIPEIQEMIRRHPDLFSSYYHVPHPSFETEYLTKFIEFANLLLANSSQTAEQILLGLRYRALDLFDAWENWSSRNGIDYLDFNVYSRERFQNDFLKFVQEVILIQEIKLLRGGNGRRHNAEQLNIR